MFARRVRLLAACALAATMIVAYDVGTDKVLSQSASVENAADHADPEDFIWDSADITEITLNGDSMTISGEGAFAEDGRLTVTSAGTYRLSGALTDGQIIVDTEDESLVRLILGGVTLGSSTGAPINIVNAEEAMIVLEAGSQNSISDAAVYVYESAGTDEPNAAIFSKSDLTFYGDGLKSDNEEDAARGTISIAAGVITVTAGGDAISAQTDVLIAGGAFVLMSGGGGKRCQTR